VDHVIWHDVECGGYAADLPLWRALAAEAGGPVLDLGAGTGRVTLDLARRGIEVHALDLDAELLAALRDRAAETGAEVDVETHVADARDFDLGLRFALVVAPMQTVQLLGGPAGRARMLRCVAAHLAPGGRFAAALTGELEDYDAALAPVPDIREVAGVVYASRPVAIRDDGDGFILERVREKVTADGRHEAAEDRVRLDHVAPATLEAEGRAAGLGVEPRLAVPETDDHVGSQVVVLRG
jgi:SAM-dependent methyltransferase